MRANISNASRADTREFRAYRTSNHNGHVFRSASAIGKVLQSAAARGIGGRTVHDANIAPVIRAGPQPHTVASPLSTITSSFMPAPPNLNVAAA